MASGTTLVDKFDALVEVKLMDLQELMESRHNRPKIQKVAEYLRNRVYLEKRYSPKSVSIGPIHHDNQNLKLGERFKLVSAAKYIEITQQNAYDLFKKIAGNIEEIMDLYAFYVLDNISVSNLELEGFNNVEEKLSWMLFVDGCFLLYIMLYVNVDQLDEPDNVKIKVDHHQLGELEQDGQLLIDELVQLNKVDQLVLVMMDVLLMENQLPFLVLKLLWKNDNETELITAMETFLQGYHLTPPDNRPYIEEDLRNHEPQPPTHLLDLQRKIILRATKKQTGKCLKEKGKVMTYRKIQDLTAVGIKLQSSKKRRPTDVDFSEGWFHGKLILPEIVVDDTTAVSFMNLVAYELCTDFKNDYGICTFLSFINSLIDNAEDVKKLRSAGILLNLLGSDQDVADLFNNITADLVPNHTKYHEIRVKIDEYHSKIYKIWMAQGIHIYFSNPWAITGVLAGFIALALTSVQTWFSVYPR